MDRHSSVVAILPPRKEKAKFHGHNSADLAEHYASVEVKTRRRKTNLSSNARVRHGHAERLPNPHVAHRMEARMATLNKARGRPLPKRGDVKAAIFKELINSTGGCWCSSPTPILDADRFLEVAPFPMKSQAAATLWPKMDMPF